MSSIRGLDDYLESLPPITFRRLYQQPATALAIYRRMLPSLGKFIATILLYNDQPIPLVDIEAFVRPESAREREDALGKLRRLHIINEQNLQISLDPIFKKNFRLALTGGGNHQSFGVPVDTSDDKKKIDVPFLDRYASRQFEAILHFLVGQPSEVQPSGGVIHLLLTSKLMEKHIGTPKITNNGFSFLLQEGNSQIWALLIQYLEIAEEFNLDKTEVLHFFLMLGSLELGQAYSVSTLSNTQKEMLTDLRDYGVVYMRKSSSDKFYPTRLATTLTSESGGLRTANASMNSALSQNAGVDKGFIIVETNFRLYAYTDSPLQIAVLNLFTKLTTRFPNLVFGQITRDSMRKATSQGITADQIINYLTVHAHPQMKKNVLVLPPTVVDQIRLWQIEGERMKTTPGYLFKDFTTPKDFEETANYAAELGVLVWRNNAKRLMFVTRHEQVADWLKRRSAKAAATTPVPSTAASTKGR